MHEIFGVKALHVTEFSHLLHELLEGRMEHKFINGLSYGIRYVT